MGPTRGAPGTSDTKYILPASWPTFQLEPIPLNDPGTKDVPPASAFQLVPPRLFSDSAVKDVPIPNPNDIGVPLHVGVNAISMREDRNPNPSELRGLTMGTAAGMLTSGQGADSLGRFNMYT